MSEKNSPDNFFFNQPVCVQQHTIKNKVRAK